jgi:LysM repeat protein/lysophospholipase L1-like esterase
MSKSNEIRIKMPALLALIFLASFSASDVRKNEHLFSGKGISDLCDTSLLFRNASYSKNINFIGYTQNTVEWFAPQDALRFFDKLQHASSKKVSVLHIGDSHVQADIYTGSLRKNVQSIFGSGGRGLIFPYAAAGTNSSVNYKSTKTGFWTYSKNTQKDPVLPLGISGVTVRTQDRYAGFAFRFADGTIQASDRIVRIFAKKDTASFDLKISFSEKFAPVVLSLQPDGKDYAEIVLPEITQDLSFEVVKSSAAQNFLELYGISLESVEDKGVVWHSTGINGASARSILKQNLFEEQLKQMKPDLVVIDLGTNDLLGKQFYANEIANNYGAILKKIKESLPDACVMIANAQEVVFNGRNVPFFADFSAFTRELARENACLFYDYYNVSGGRYGMDKWYDLGLAQKDKIHLTREGYDFKGELFFRALMNGYRYVLESRQTDVLIAAELDSTFFDIKFSDENLMTSAGKISENAETKFAVDNTKEYTVLPGESLSVVAQKFGVTVSELMDWNNLITTKLSAGKKLFVRAPSSHAKKPTVTAAPPMPQDGKKTASAVKSTNLTANTHKVKNGDSLWVIAKKYGTSVEKIKTLNGLKSEKLQIGQILKIK